MILSYVKNKALEYTDVYCMADLLPYLPVNCTDCYDVVVSACGNMPVVTLTPSSNPTGWDTLADDLEDIVNACVESWEY